MLFIVKDHINGRMCRGAAYHALNMHDALTQVEEHISLSVFNTYEMVCPETGESTIFSKRSLTTM